MRKLDLMKHKVRLMFGTNRTSTKDTTVVNNQIKWLAGILTTLTLLIFTMAPVTSNAQLVIEDERVLVNFGVDADLYSGRFGIIPDGNPDSTNTDDWFDTLTTSGIGVILNYGAPNLLSNTNIAFTIGAVHPPFTVVNNIMMVDAIYGRDMHYAGNAKDSTVFKGNSNKNGDNPAFWQTTNGSNPQKNDIIDFFGHLRRDGATIDSSLWAFFGITTRSGDGSSHNDVELFRAPGLTYTVAGGFANAGPENGHTAWQFDSDGLVLIPGDILVSIDFDKGGTTPNGSVRVWIHESYVNGANNPGGFNSLDSIPFKLTGVYDQGNGSGDYGYAEIELVDANAPAAVFATLNIDPTPAAPWGTISGPQGNVDPIIGPYQLMEIGVNMSALGLDVPSIDPNTNQCGNLFGWAVPKTRSSGSFTSELKDFAGPYEFGRLEQSDVTITKSKDIDCNPGNPILTATTAVGGFDFSWTGPGIVGPSNTSTIEVDEDGKYFVTVSYPGGLCSVTDSIEVLIDTVTADFTIIKTDPLCTGDANGTAKVVINNFSAQPNWYYEWSTNETTDSIGGLVEGWYYVTVTGSNGCFAIDSVQLIDPPPLVIDSVIADTTVCGYNVTCNGDSDGQATVYASGGTGAYTYTWSSGAFTQTATGLSAIKYYITVHDANNCEAIDSITLTEPDELLITGITPSVYSCGYNISCNGEFDGWLEVTATGGNDCQPYIYAWEGPNGYTGAVDSIDGLEAGWYKVTVTDVLGCFAVDSFELIEPEPLVIDTIIPSIYSCGYNISCNGEADGTLEVLASGGNDCELYTYAWEGPESYSSSDSAITGLVAGWYIVTVTDIQGCFVVDSFELTEPDPLIIDSIVPSVYSCDNNISCYDAQDGTLAVYASGGNDCQNYTYAWEGPASYTASTSSISNLDAGWYYITVTDIQGCFIADSFELVQPDELVIDSFSATIYNCGYNVSCHGEDDGGLKVHASGGNDCEDYTYNWTGPESFSASTDTIGNLIAGWYYVTVTDIQGCFVIDSFEITEPDTLDVTETFSNYNGYNISCNGGNDGWINIEVSGGCANYTFEWYFNGSNTAFSTLEDPNNLYAGDYTVIVTDANGCVYSEDYTLNEPPVLSCEITEPTYDILCGYSGYQLSGVGDGGVPGYTYAWTVTSQNGSWSITSDTTLATITYNAGDFGDTATFTLKIIDANGCETTCQIELACTGVEHCTMTQGFYGNRGGEYCDGTLTPALLDDLLLPANGGPIVIGRAGVGANSATFATSTCIIEKLPAGGPEIAITGGDNNTCTNDFPGIVHSNQGTGVTLANTLVAQTLTMSLNLRLDQDHDLSAFPIGGPAMVTLETTSCGQDPAQPILGTEDTFYIPMIVVDYLGAGATVADLLDLANDALAGIYVPTVSGDPSLIDITEALKGYNDGFDECRFFVKYFTPVEVLAKTAEEVITNNSNSEIAVNVYPNPFTTNTTIEFTIPTDSKVTVEVYNITGSKIATVFEGNVDGGMKNSVEFNESGLTSGTYIYKISTDNSSSVGKLILIK